MKRRWNRKEDLGQELREARPEPRPDFLAQVEHRVGTYREWSTGRLKLAFAVIGTAALLVPLTAFGALGDASHGARAAFGAAAQFGSPATPPSAPQPAHPSGGPAGDQYRPPPGCIQAALARFQAALEAAHAQFMQDLQNCVRGDRACIFRAIVNFHNAIEAAGARLHADLQACGVGRGGDGGDGGDGGHGGDGGDGGNGHGGGDGGHGHGGGD